MITDIFINVNYCTSGRGAKYGEKRVHTYRVRSHISKITCPNFTKFSVRVTCAVARSSSDEIL